MTAKQGGVSDCKRPQTTTALMAQGKTMTEHDETQQEKETRWTAQRAAHDRQQQDYRAARTRRRGRNWLVVGAIVIIVAVIAAVMLLK
jgi:Flp pilus assembly protein TadB